MWYSNLEKIFISRRILHQHWYTCPIALPVPRNLQHRGLLTVVSATYAPPFRPLRHQRNVCHPAVNRFTRQTLPTVDRKHFFMNILCIEYFCPQKKCTTELCPSVVHTSSTFTILTCKPVSEHAQVRLLPGLSWSWTVLLPSDTHRKPVTSIIVVLLAFVTYLLTLLCIRLQIFWRNLFVYSVYYKNEGASSSFSDIDRFVTIRKLPDYIFNIFLAFIC
jgi:hypothetical protein